MTACRYRGRRSRPPSAPSPVYDTPVGQTTTPARRELDKDTRHDTDLDYALMNLHDDQSAVDDAVTAVLNASRRYRARGLPGEIMSTRAMVSVILASDQRRRQRLGIHT